MSNKFLPRCHPIWGFPAHMTIADFPATQQTSGTELLKDVAVTTKSEAFRLGARSIELEFKFADGDATFDLELITMEDAVTEKVVKTWTGLTAAKSQSVFAGNLEMIDLEGKPIKVQVIDPTGKVTVLAKVTS